MKSNCDVCKCETENNVCTNEDCAIKDVDLSTLEGWASNVEVEDAMDVLKVISTAYQDLRAHLNALDQAIREGFTNIQFELGTVGNALLDKKVISEEDLYKARKEMEENVIKARDELMEQMKKQNMEGESQGEGTI